MYYVQCKDMKFFYFQKKFCIKLARFVPAILKIKKIKFVDKCLQLSEFSPNGIWFDTKFKLDFDTQLEVGVQSRRHNNKKKSKRRFQKRNTILEKCMAIIMI